MGQDEQSETRWTRRANTITVVWKALWPVLCGIAALGLATFEAVGSFKGHPIDPQAVVMITGFGTLPLFGGRS